MRVETRTLLHRDDGLATTATAGETIADLELLVIARFLPQIGTVLDIGCGRGRSSVYLNLQGFDTIGVEIDMPTLIQAKQLNIENNASCEFVRADGRNLCFREKCFDYAVSFGSTLSEKYRLWLKKRGQAKNNLRGRSSDNAGRSCRSEFCSSILELQTSPQFYEKLR